MAKRKENQTNVVERQIAAAANERNEAALNQRSGRCAAAMRNLIHSAHHLGEARGRMESVAPRHRERLASYLRVQEEKLSEALPGFSSCVKK